MLHFIILSPLINCKNTCNMGHGRTNQFIKLKDFSPQLLHDNCSICLFLLRANWKLNQGSLHLNGPPHWIMGLKYVQCFFLPSLFSIFYLKSLFPGSGLEHQNTMILFLAELWQEKLFLWDFRAHQNQQIWLVWLRITKPKDGWEDPLNLVCPVTIQFSSGIIWASNSVCTKLAYFNAH